MSPEDFLSTLFDGLEGHLCLAATNGRGEWNKQRFFTLPEQLDEAVTDAEWSLESSLGYSPFLYEEPARKGDVPGITRVVGLDADHHGPDEFRLPPSIIVETSPDSYHLLWLLDEPVDKTSAVAVGKRMRDVHGLEASATNLSKILRFPGSLNVDSSKVLDGKLEPYRVTATSTGQIYSLADLEDAYPAPVGADTPAPEPTPVSTTLPDKLPSLFEVDSKLPTHERLEWLMNWREVDQVGQERERRSERIHELCHLMLELGLTPEEAVVLGWTAEPVREHYEQQNRTQEEFWRFDIMKAVRQKNLGVQVVDDVPDPTPSQPKPKPTHKVTLLTDEERQFVRDNPTWIDWWVQQCYSRLDERTPKQYLVAFGYLLLSCALGMVTGSYNDDRVSPNLYVLNLGPTGTGKTKALRFWRKCLHALEGAAGFRIDIGNDASPEGLIKALKDHHDRTAVFTRDEVGGMFAEWLNRGYQVRAAETFMDLYDNEVPTRLLASKDAANPDRVRLHAFNVYLTGTPEKVFRVLTHEFYETGFMQRLVPVLGERDEETETSYREAKRQGDPRTIKAADELPEQIATDLYRVATMWSGRADRPVLFMREDAWDRWVDFGWTMRLAVQDLEHGELLAAITERLATSVQKMSILLAAQRESEWVELRDLLPVIEHAEDWVRNLIYISSEISESEHSRRVDEAVTFLRERGGRVQLRDFYSRFRALTTREADDILSSLKTRALATEQRDPKSKNEDENRPKWLALLE